MKNTFALIVIPDGKHFVKSILPDKSVTLTSDISQAMKFENADQAIRFGKKRLKVPFLTGVYDADKFDSKSDGGEG